MADKKISQLSVAASLTGSEPLPLVQGGATLQATVNQIQTAPITAQTANGVMYLNGSKVPTAGSSLVFSGGNLLLGVNTNPNSRRLLVNGPGSGTTYLSVGDISQTANEVVLGVDPANSLSRLTSTAWDLSFGASGAEKMRLTTAGDLLVGTTSLAGAGGVSFQSQGGTGFAVINNNNAGATGYVFVSFRRSSTEIGSVTQNGTTAVLFNTTSDRRLKDNIAPAPSASDVIDAIEIVSHDWKAAPDEHVTYGVIAQDLALVAPQAVLQGDDGDEIEKTWGVDYSKLVPMLIKELQSLRARVAALEAA